MNIKFIKIFITLFFILSLYMSFVFATDINLNLPGTSNTTNNVDTSNTINTEFANNVIDNTVNNENTVSNEQNTNVQDDIFNSDNTEVETLSPSDISSTSNSELSTTNIINIFSNN